MSGERRKAVWPWVVFLPVWLPILYAASFGPACWLADRKVVSSLEVYRPLARLAARKPGLVRDAYSSYAVLFSPKGGMSPAAKEMLMDEWRVRFPPLKLSR